MTVPYASAPMPNFGAGSLGNQPSKVKKLAVLAFSAGTAFAIRKIAIATMMTSTIAPAASVRARNADSAPKPRRRGSAPPPPIPEPLARGSGGTGPPPRGAVSMRVSADGAAPAGRS
jgi:hypothetical protein